MGNYSKVQLERRERGVCMDCGGVLEAPGKFVKCRICRMRSTDKTREYRMNQRKEALQAKPTPNQIWAKKKMQMEAEKAIATAKYRKQIEKCVYCEWAKIEDDIVYCPFMKGICMKRRD